MQFNRRMTLAVGVAALLFSACSKSNNNGGGSSQTKTGETLAASFTGGTLTGSSTMTSGTTYNITSDIVVPVGDTLLLQSGVTLKMGSNVDVLIHGTFISLGTKASPNWITTGATKNDSPIPIASYATDPAFAGTWYGLNCDTTCPLFVMKWTHVEFAGGTFGAAPVAGTAANTASFAIMFQNINGSFDMEDSWIYGSTDDAVRITDGKVNIMRNTFEKCGSNTGESVNVKSGTQGDIAYNLFMGAATNGSKISNAGATPIECNVHCYNNTYVDCGYRQSSTSGHGGSINLEKGGEATIYNNLIVNCKIGLRIVSTADTNNAHYGNTYFYGDAAAVTGDFYSVGDVTHPQTTDIPAPSTYLPSTYTLGASYDGTALVGQNNPQFKTFTLPNTNYQEVDYVSGFDFHLNSGSQAIGKGTTSFTAMALVKLDPNYGATEITQPGSDIGCYQSNGTGNAH